MVKRKQSKSKRSTKSNGRAKKSKNVKVKVRNGNASIATIHDGISPELGARLEAFGKAWRDRSPSNAIELLRLANLDTPKNVALCLRNSSIKISPVSIGKFLSVNKPLNSSVLQEYVNLLDFRNLTILEALRLQFSHFCVDGEGQIVNRVLETFAFSFCQQNKDIFKSQSNCCMLALLILTLNTALHNPKEDRKISEEQWMEYCQDIAAAEPYCTDSTVRSIWRDIRCFELRMPFEGKFSDMVRRGPLVWRTSGCFVSWRPVFCVLTPDCLYGFKSSDDERDPCFILSLRGVDVVRVPSSTRFCFQISPLQSPFIYYKQKNDGSLLCHKKNEKFAHFAAHSDLDLELWIQDIDKVTAG